MISNHQEFEEFLYQEVRAGRTNWSEDECRETAALAARAVPDSGAAREKFLTAFFIGKNVALAERGGNG